MGVQMVPCPACDGTGEGSAPLPGPTCAAGMCSECRASGEVTATKRERLLRSTEGRVQERHNSLSDWHAVAGVSPAEARGLNVLYGWLKYRVIELTEEE